MLSFHMLTYCISEATLLIDLYDICVYYISHCILAHIGEIPSDNQFDLLYKSIF